MTPPVVIPTSEVLAASAYQVSEPGTVRRAASSCSAVVPNVCPPIQRVSAVDPRSASGDRAHLIAGNEAVAHPKLPRDAHVVRTPGGTRERYPACRCFHGPETG